MTDPKNTPDPAASRACHPDGDAGYGTGPTTGDGGVGYGDAVFSATAAKATAQFSFVDDAVEFLRGSGWTIGLDLNAATTMLPETWDSSATFADDDSVAKAVCLFGFTCTRPPAEHPGDTFTAEEAQAAEALSPLFGGDDMYRAGPRPAAMFRVIWRTAGPPARSVLRCRDLADQQAAIEYAATIAAAKPYGDVTLEGPDGWRALLTNSKPTTGPGVFTATLNLRDGKLTGESVDRVTEASARARLAGLERALFGEASGEFREAMADAGKESACDCILCRLTDPDLPTLEDLLRGDLKNRAAATPTDADLKGTAARTFMGLDLSTGPDSHAWGVGLPRGGFIMVEGELTPELQKVIETLHGSGSSAASIERDVKALQSLKASSNVGDDLAGLVMAGRLSRNGARAYMGLPSLEAALKAESRRFAIDDVARMFAVPASLLTDPPYARGGAVKPGRAYMPGERGRESFWPTDRVPSLWPTRPTRRPAEVDGAEAATSATTAACHATNAATSANSAAVDANRAASAAARAEYAATPWWVRAHRAGVNALRDRLDAPVTWGAVGNMALAALLLVMAIHFGGGILAYVLTGGGQ